MNGLEDIFVNNGILSFQRCMLATKFKDVFKKSFLQSDMYAQAISVSTIITIIIDLLVSVGIGVLIYFVYKRLFCGVVYSRTFAMTLVAMTVITCAITLAISTNVVISLGMVGALSIVRFRTAVKEPLDTIYLFWAISMGIACGASMYILVILTMIVVYGILKIMSNKKQENRTYVMIVHYTKDETCDRIFKYINDLNYKIKSRVMRKDDTELTVTLVCSDDNNLIFSERIRDLEDVRDVSLIQFDGEYHG